MITLVVTLTEICLLPQKRVDGRYDFTRICSVLKNHISLKNTSKISSGYSYDCQKFLVKSKQWNIYSKEMPLHLIHKGLKVHVLKRTTFSIGLFRNMLSINSERYFNNTSACSNFIHFLLNVGLPLEHGETLMPSDLAQSYC